jgi:hypothetical protein
LSFFRGSRLAVNNQLLFPFAYSRNAVPENWKRVGWFMAAARCRLPKDVMLREQFDQHSCAALTAVIWQTPPNLPFQGNPEPSQ